MLPVSQTHGDKASDNGGNSSLDDFIDIDVIEQNSAFEDLSDDDRPEKQLSPDNDAIDNFVTQDNYQGDYGSYNDISADDDTQLKVDRNYQEGADDEVGIFSDANKDTSNKKSIVAAIAFVTILVLVVAGTAYYLYSKPDVFKQIKSVLITPESEGEPVIKSAVSLDKSSNQAIEKVEKTLGDDGMPPQPKPIPSQSSIGSKDDKLNSVSSSEQNVSTNLKGIEAQSKSLNKEVDASKPAASKRDDELINETNTKTFHVENAGVDISRIVNDLPASTVKDKVPPNTVSTDINKSAVAQQPPTPVKSPFDELERDDEENRMYDSPPGDLLAKMPAPSINPKRPGNQSIIVVHPAGAAKTEKSSNRSKSYNSQQNLTIETTNNDRQLVAADRAMRLGLYDSAAGIYDDLYKKNPKDVGVLIGRAVLYQKTGDVDRAMDTYEDVLDLSPENPEAIINLAGLVRKQKPAVALEKLLSLREKYPKNVVVAAQLGVAYADSGNLVDAYKYLDLAVSLDPHNPQHYFNQAVVADRAGDRERAISLYEKALEIDAVYGTGRAIPRDQIYDRLSALRS